MCLFICEFGVYVYGVFVGVGGQLAGVSYLLLPCRLMGIELRSLGLAADLLLAEPYHHPRKGLSISDFLILFL